MPIRFGQREGSRRAKAAGGGREAREGKKQRAPHGRTETAPKKRGTNKPHQKQQQRERAKQAATGTSAAFKRPAAPLAWLGSARSEEDEEPLPR